MTRGGPEAVPPMAGHEICLGRSQRIGAFHRSAPSDQSHAEVAVMYFRRRIRAHGAPRSERQPAVPTSRAIVV